MSRESVDFRELKARVMIAQLLAARGLLGTLRPRGHRLVGPCPVHGGDNPTAFVVDTHRNTWRCFTRCQRGGDLIELVRALDRVGYREAGLVLAQLAHLPAPAEPRAAPPGRPPPFVPYTRRLHLEPDAPFLARKQISAATARRFEAGAYRGRRGFLARCIGVRLHDAGGRPLGYAGRRLDPDEAQRFGKWKFPPRLPKGRLLYGWHHLARAREPLVLVECPWAVMRLAQLGVHAVALLGVHLSEPQRQLLSVADRIVLLLDGDPAGRDAASHLARRLAPTHDVNVVTLTDGCDPDDLSDEDLRRAIAAP
jgi:DNA primase